MHIFRLKLSIITLIENKKTKTNLSNLQKLMVLLFPETLSLQEEGYLKFNKRKVKSLSIYINGNIVLSPGVAEWYYNFFFFLSHIHLYFLGAGEVFSNPLS